MAAIRIIDDHIQLASIGSKTHVQIEGHIQGIGNYAFPAADGGADQVLKTNGAGVLAWIDKNHSIASHNDTTATGAQLNTLVDNSIADALHRHSELVASDGSLDPVLSIDAAGQVQISINQNAVTNVEVINTTDDTTALASATFATSGGRVFRVANAPPGFTAISEFAGAGYFDTNSFVSEGFIFSASATTGKIRFYTAGRTSAQMRMIINNVGNIGMGTPTPATSAKLELSSTTGALLLTRMTTTQRDALTAVNGMLLYNSTLNKFQGYEGGAWASLI